MYGGHLHSGLAGIAGERYAADALRMPASSPFTQASRGGTLRALYGEAPRMPTLVYGEIPLEEIEGHQVDPFYDVRGGGLGRVHRITDGKRSGNRDQRGLGFIPIPTEDPPSKFERSWRMQGRPVPGMTMTEAREARSQRERWRISPEAGMPTLGTPTLGATSEALPGEGFPTRYLLYGGLALVAFTLLKKKGR